MSNRKFRVYVSCCVDACAEETCYPIDMLRWADEGPVCQNCFEQDSKFWGIGPDGEPTAYWHDLEPLKPEEAVFS